jgi:transposase
MQLEFSSKECELLEYERYHHPHPWVQRKMEVVWLKSLGKAEPEISQIANVSLTTVYRYLASYREGGIEKLKEVTFYRPQSEFVEHKAKIEAYFLEQPPATMKEAAHRLEELTGIKRSEPQVSQFLKTLGIKRRKVGMIPAKADTEKQAAFKQEQLEVVLEAAQQGKKKSTL